ncbi:MAG: glycosyltransferase family 4 protein [Candidatus Kapabacteria bacterium]|nr:glycosyltransferase family 4 protein [Candidatus Kapabacteria bacterium]
MSPFHLGFAIVWNRDGDRARTWSHTPWSLWEALERRDDVLIHDVPVVIPKVADFAGRLLAARIVKGRPWTSWSLRPTYARFARHALKSSITRAGAIDAVLSIGDNGPADKPLYLYQDYSFGHALESFRQTHQMPVGWEHFPVHALERRAAMQAQTYASSAGVFTMSKWNADFLVRSGLVHSTRVHVVHCGINVPVEAPSDIAFEHKRSRDERVLLFAGRDFYRKGGDLVLQSFEHAKRISSRPLRLVVAGPKSWPMSGPVPEHVHFIGDASFGTLREHMRNADAMVMPSRFEAFGIVFAEALAAGTPVIGRNAFAMPEMIENGRNGYLIEDDDTIALAELMVRVVEDDEMAWHCRRDSENIAAKFSWNRVAADMISVMKASHES